MTGQEELKAVFADRLKKARATNRMSQAALAKSTEIAQANISRIETGRTLPNAYRMVKLATGLGVSTDYLVGLSDTPHGRSDHTGGLLHRSVDILASEDRELVQGFIRLLLQRSQR